jgi:tetratricopeptide (TPR) repeat protein
MLKQYPPDYYIAANLAAGLFENGQTEDALSIFNDDLLKLCWTNHRLLNTYAWFWARKGENLKSAYRASKRSLELAPENHYYWDTLSMIYWKKKEYDKAIEAEEKALTYSPGNKDYKQRIKDIKKEMKKK